MIEVHAMDAVFRAFSAQVDDVNNDDRSITAKISTFSVDRHNTVFDSRGCDLNNYNNNRVVLWEHSRDPLRGALPIGTNLWIKVDRSSNPKLIAKTKFKKDDFSQQLFEAYRDGEMSGWSISAMPIDFGPPTKDEVRSRPELANVDLVFRKYDLVEYSAVAVPSCVDALTVDDYRSISKLISRGIPVPDDISEAIKQFSESLVVQEPSGLILPETATEPTPEPDAEVRNAKCAEPDGDEDGEEEEEHEDEKEDEDEEEDEKAKEKRSEPEIVLPPLNGRTFQQVYLALMQDEIEFRRSAEDEIRAKLDWLFGKV